MNLFILLSSIPIYLMYVLHEINPSNRVCIIQRNTSCIILSYDHTTQLFQEIKFMKFVDLVSVENSIFISKFVLVTLTLYLTICIIWPLADSHQTRFAMNSLLIQTSCNTSKFDTKAFSYFIITSCFAFQALFSENLFSIMSPLSLKIS